MKTIVGLTLLLAMGCGKTGNPAEPVPITREAFRAKMIKIKTAKQCIALLGRPDDTMEYMGTISYEYRHRTINPVTLKVDSSASVHFDDDGPDAKLDNISFR